jgi:PTH2 family peptidyl-tRNA hydrolase
LRADIKMSPGKKVVQGAHASLMASEKAKKMTPDTWKAWYKEGQRKIACKIESLEAMLNLKSRVESTGIPCDIVADAGLTELEPGTITALGIGPALAGVIDPITKDLKLL